MNNFLLVLRGPSGSGKTSIAKSIQQKAGDKIAHLKADYFYWKVSPNDPNKHIDNNPIVYENLVDLAENYLEHGYSVIIEGLLNQIDNFRAQDKLVKLAEENKAKFVRIYLEVDFDTANQRHSGSDFSVPIEEVEGWRKDRPMHKFSSDNVINTSNSSVEKIVKQIRELLM